jgi:Protein of unknown function (DUF3102)
MITAVTTNPVLAEHATAIRQLGKRVVADVIEIGARLTECKRVCGHGNWLPWLDREFGWNETTAQRFIRVHKLAQSKSGKLPDLPMSAFYLLAAPSTPKEATDEIIERAQSGKVIKFSEVRDAIKRREAAEKKRPRRRDKIIAASGTGNDPTEIDPIQEPCDDCETEQDFWQRSLSNLAGDAISMPAFWKRQFGAGWKKFKVTSDLVTLAKQAAEAWNELANELVERSQSNG